MRRIFSIVFLTLLLTSMFNIQQAKAETGTIYIRADGSVEPSTAPIRRDGDVYTFTSDIYDSIVVERDNIIIDGAGYTLQGTGSGTGVNLTRRTNVTVRNTQIKNFQYGIWLESSNNNTLSGNNIENNIGGIFLSYFSDNNTLSGNNIANNLVGIFLFSSSGNVMRGNTFTNDGLFVWDSYGNVVEDNTVNGKPLVYLEGVKNYNVSDAGQVILVSCSNIRVENLNLSRAIVGVQLWGTNNSIISGNNIVANNYAGIFLSYSSNNVIRGNTFTDDGLIVSDSYGNVVEDNTVNGKSLVYLEGVTDYVVGDAGQVVLVNCSNIRVENLDLSRTSVGVQLWGTNNSIISRNNIANNLFGVWLYYSSSNVISENNITANNSDGIRLDSSNYNTISGNNIENNIGGMLFGYYSFDNTFYHNNFIDNTVQVYGYISTNVWDDGYPSGGNYWSDYNGTDTDGDGIGDTPYVIDENNRDRYPLMKPWTTTPNPTPTPTLTPTPTPTSTPTPTTTPSGAAGFPGSEMFLIAVAVVAIVIIISVIILLTKRRRETQPPA